MTPPRVTRELLGQHPALQRFVEYVELHSGAGVDLDRIAIRTQRESLPDATDNNVAQDGIVELIYTPSENCQVNQNCPFFYGKIHGPAQAIFLRHGWVTPRINPQMQVTMEQNYPMENMPHPVEGACETVHAIGGADEANAECQSLNPSEWMAISAGANWLGLDLFGTLIGRSRWGSMPFSRFMFRNFRPVGTQNIPWLQRLTQTAPGIAAGGLAMVGTHLGVAPAMGLDTPYHYNERFAMSAVAAQGANHGTHYLLQRLATRGSAAQSASLPAAGSRVGVASFGSALISAALVDALVGPAFGEEGSTSREVLRGSAFFLPQIYRGAMGSRTLALTASRPRVRLAGRVLGYGAVAAFVTDLGHMGYNYVSDGAVGSGRDHALYQRAGEIQNSTEGGSLLRGALGMIAPSLTERYGVDETYVNQARQEFEIQANSMSENAAQLLRQTIIHGDAGQNRELAFYQGVDLHWLQGDNQLGTVRQEGRPDWYLSLVAEDLGDPNLVRTSLEGRSSEEQIRFMQGQYNWDLSNGDVQEIFNRIALHHAREQIAQVHYLVQPEDNALARHFDAEGRLLPTQRDALLNQLFATGDRSLSTEQILGLRKVGLLVRIRQLREDLRGIESQRRSTTQQANLTTTQRDLAHYEGLARGLGLMDESGAFVAGELTDHANRVTIRPAQIVTQPRFTGADLIREVYGTAAYQDMTQ